MMNGKINVRVPPQLVGAENANLDDIQQELHNMDVNYLPERLLEIYERRSGNFEPLCDVNDSEFMLKLDFNEDETSAYLNIVPPKTMREPLTTNKVLNFLRNNQVSQGVLQNSIEEMIQQQVHYEYTLIAQGQSAIHGEDGYPEIFFTEDKLLLHEQAQINLREIPLLQKVSEGKVLLRVIPPTEGVEGYTINGKVNTQTHGKVFRIRLGRNTQFNESRNEIIATKSGVICLIGDALGVEDFKVVERIEESSFRFDGVLHVKGNIADRAKVEAVRIDVEGAVGKAYLKAMGDIRIQEDVKGTTIQAGGSFVAGSVMNANVQAAEHIVVQTRIINSKIYAGESLKIVDDDGDVSGGSVQAGNIMLLSNIGKFAGGKRTEIEVGISISSMQHMRTIRNHLKDNLAQFRRMKGNLDPLLKQLIKGNLMTSEQTELNQLSGKLAKIPRLMLQESRKIQEFDELKARNERLNGGIIIIPGRVSIGTEISIRRQSFDIIETTYGEAYFFISGTIQSRNFREALQEYQSYFVNIPLK